MRCVNLSAATVGLVLLLSGCLDATGDADAQGRALRGGGGAPTVEGFDPQWAEHALPFGEGHSHQDVEQHERLSTPNFQIVGFDPLRTDWYGRAPGGYGCSSTVSDGKQRLSVTNSFNTDVGLIITDVTDPARPQKIGELVLPSTHVYDNTLTPDLKHVLLATSPLESGPEDATKPPLDEAPYFRDACTGDVAPLLGPEQSLPYAAGLILVDIANPRVPRIVDFLVFPPLGAHSIRAFEVNNDVLLIASIFGYTGATSYYMLLDIVEVPNGAKMVPLAPIYPPSHRESPQRAQQWGVHDAFIQKHPVTGELLAYLADIYHGVWIAKIDNVRSPELIAHWDHVPTFGRDMIVHGVTPTDLWDGRHYTFVGEECYNHFQDTPTCVVITLDTTDPRKPQAVSAWTIPIDVQWAATLQWSLHYAGLLNRTLLVTNYHGGIWAVDVSSPQAIKTMPSIGIFIPDRSPPEPIRGGSNSFWNQDILKYRPIVWDFDVLEDGTVITYDFNSGLYALRFDASNPAPSPDPWPMDKYKFVPMN